MVTGSSDVQLFGRVHTDLSNVQPFFTWCKTADRIDRGSSELLPDEQDRRFKFQIFVRIPDGETRVA